MSEENAEAACEYVLLKLPGETLYVSPAEHQVSASRLSEIAKKVLSDRCIEDAVDIRWRHDGTLFFAPHA